MSIGFLVPWFHKVEDGRKSPDIDAIREYAKNTLGIDIVGDVPQEGGYTLIVLDDGSLHTLSIAGLCEYPKFSSREIIYG